MLTNTVNEYDFVVSQGDIEHVIDSLWEMIRIAADNDSGLCSAPALIARLAQLQVFVEMMRNKSVNLAEVIDCLNAGRLETDKIQLPDGNLRVYSDGR